jgi:hypothetical protein
VPLSRAHVEPRTWNQTIGARGRQLQEALSAGDGGSTVWAKLSGSSA